eukprot:TCALIF_11958-PA protein Name:"Similar to TUFM Elongation factor Tu, mitochondrial (Bos taurus)" AED:0.21 eAED:0.21 QI:143/0.66/1/1/0.66/0.75/4/362/246
MASTLSLLTLRSSLWSSSSGAWSPHSILHSARLAATGQGLLLKPVGSHWGAGVTGVAPLSTSCLRFQKEIFKRDKPHINIGIEMFHKTLEEANAGDQMGILIRGLKRDDVRRGMFASKPGSVKQHNQVMAQVYLLNKEEGGSDKPLVSESGFCIYSKTWDTTVFPHIIGKEMAMPGEDSQILMQFNKPMALEKNQTFTIRQEGRTVGTGKFTEIKKSMTEAQLNYLTCSRKKKDQLKASGHNQANV